MAARATNPHDKAAWLKLASDWLSLRRNGEVQPNQHAQIIGFSVLVCSPARYVRRNEDADPSLAREEQTAAR